MYDWLGNKVRKIFRPEWGKGGTPENTHSSSTGGCPEVVGLTQLMSCFVSVDMCGGSRQSLRLVHQDPWVLQVWDEINPLYKERWERESSVWAICYRWKKKKKRIVITVNPLDPHKTQLYPYLYDLLTKTNRLSYISSAKIGFFGIICACEAEKAMAPHSSNFAWKIPWVEEPGRLQSMGSLRVGHDWATSLSLFTFMHWRRKWQPTPVFLPGESYRRWAAVYGVTQSRTQLKQLSSSSSACEVRLVQIPTQQGKEKFFIGKKS